MKILLLPLLVLCLSSCSDKEEFYSTTAFKDQFTNGLFAAKLTNNNIPYQFDYFMGEQYILVHPNFKEALIQLRKASLKESKSLILINLSSDCSQQALSNLFKESNIYHMTLNKRDIPMIRVTSTDHNSDKVSVILDDYTWRCD